MSRTVKIDLKQEDYFGNVTFVDGKLDQIILQIYSHKKRVHSDTDILEAIAAQIADEVGSEDDTTVRTSDVPGASNRGE